MSHYDRASSENSSIGGVGYLGHDETTHVESEGVENGSSAIRRGLLASSKGSEWIVQVFKILDFKFQKPPQPLLLFSQQAI